MKTIAIIILCLFLSSCAPFPSQINPATITSQKYSHLTCNEINKRLETVRLEEGNLSRRQQKRANTDVVFLTLGGVFFWPALLIWPLAANMNKSHKDEIALLRGEQEALKELRLEKQCFTHSRQCDFI